MDTKLLPHEWASTTFLLILLFTLSMFAFFNREEPFPSYEETRDSSKPTVTIHLQGAIENPGNYTVNKNTSLQTVLKKAGLKPEANLTKINFKKKLTKDLSFHIPKQELVHINLVFENYHETLLVPKGMYAFELIDQLTLPENADWRVLNSKKKLNKTQTIHIPERKLKS